LKEIAPRFGDPGSYFLMTSKRRFQLLSGVEGVCAIKHTSHIRHFGHVPLVERLVEGFCSIKHTSHIRHVGHVPIVERLVKGGCAKKNTSHILHFGHVPLVDVVGGKSVSETLVREGYAYATPRRRRASDGEDYLGSVLAEAEAAAKRDQRGLWWPCGDASPVVPVATFDDIDFQPTPTKDYGDAPAKYKSCAEFEFYEDALAIFERAPESVRKRLDRDGDGVPCPGLPHTTDRERYRFKKRAEASS